MLPPPQLLHRTAGLVGLQQPPQQQEEAAAAAKGGKEQAVRQDDARRAKQASRQTCSNASLACYLTTLAKVS